MESLLRHREIDAGLHGMAANGWHGLLCVHCVNPAGRRYLLVETPKMLFAWPESVDCEFEASWEVVLG